MTCVVKKLSIKLFVIKKDTWPHCFASESCEGFKKKKKKLIRGRISSPVCFNPEVFVQTLAAAATTEVLQAAAETCVRAE